MPALATNKHILIMAGGTGGHVFPGLAVAAQLESLGHKVSWLGTAAGIEAKLVPAANIDLHIINISGVRGKGVKGLLLAPFKIIQAILQSLNILKNIQPDCVLGLGGFAGGPGGIAAKIMSIPLVIHEQNAVAGTTNRILAPLAEKVLQAFPAAFSKNKKAVTVGNPVRNTIKASALSTQEKINVLVLGGSLGAKAVNEIMPLVFSELCAKINLWHQAGSRHIDAVKPLYGDANIDGEYLRVSDFIEDMAAAYQWADVVICRSGAMTVSEIAVAALPAIFIPYPFAIDDHQTANANWLVNSGAAFLMPQNTMTVNALKTQLQAFIDDRNLLDIMQKRASAVAINNAAERVADTCLELAL